MEAGEDDLMQIFQRKAKRLLRRRMQHPYHEIYRDEYGNVYELSHGEYLDEYHARLELIYWLNDREHELKPDDGFGRMCNEILVQVLLEPIWPRFEQECKQFLAGV
jgi:hypothetical protein